MRYLIIVLFALLMGVTNSAKAESWSVRALGQIQNKYVHQETGTTFAPGLSFQGYVEAEKGQVCLDITPIVPLTNQRNDQGYAGEVDFTAAWSPKALKTPIGAVQPVLTGEYWVQLNGMGDVVPLSLELNREVRVSKSLTVTPFVAGSQWFGTNDYVGNKTLLTAGARADWKVSERITVSAQLARTWTVSGAESYESAQGTQYHKAALYGRIGITDAISKRVTLGLQANATQGQGIQVGVNVALAF
jgi:hypothetical protein